MSQEEISQLNSDEKLTKVLVELAAMHRLMSDLKLEIGELKGDLLATKIETLSTLTEIKEQLVTIENNLDVVVGDIQTVRANQRGLEKRLKAVEQRPLQ